MCGTFCVNHPTYTILYVFFIACFIPFSCQKYSFIALSQIKCRNFLFFIIKLLPLGSSKCEKHENSDFTN